MDRPYDKGCLSFENGLTADEKKLLHLRSRSAGLTLCGCAHAAFVCQMLHSLRYGIKKHFYFSETVTCAVKGDLAVGILGLGRLGNQLLRVLLDKTCVQPVQIRISTRNSDKSVPEGVQCFYGNSRLATWADILFICCLPSHLPKICRDLCFNLSKHCLVYSFPSSVPLTRLSRLLDHDFIIKPEYDFVPCDIKDFWLSWSDLTKALSDPLLVESSCPLSVKGGLTLRNSTHWVSAVLYSLLNICTYANLEPRETLFLINDTLQGKCPNFMFEVNVHSFVSGKVSKKRPFSWISLIDVQTQDTPFQQFLSECNVMQQCISTMYKTQMIPH